MIVFYICAFSCLQRCNQKCSRFRQKAKVQVESYEVVVEAVDDDKHDKVQESISVKSIKPLVSHTHNSSTGTVGTTLAPCLTENEKANTRY